MIAWVYGIAAIALVGPAFGDINDDLRDAVSAGNVDRVKSLLDAGADPNAPWTNNFTPIFLAERPDVIVVLAAHGANINARACMCSPIERAAEKSYDDPKLRDFWKMIVATFRSIGAEYTIDTAIYLNDLPFIEQRIAADSSWVNRSRGALCVPLRLAVRTGRVEICKRLLDHEADPNAFEEGHGYPIMVNAVKHPQVVKLLIEHGANRAQDHLDWRVYRYMVHRERSDCPPLRRPRRESRIGQAPDRRGT